MTTTASKAIIVFASLLSVGCATNPSTPLETYLEKYDYLAFKPSRSSDGIGTVIDFKAGSESVVARADQCLLVNAQPQRRNAAIPTLEYTVNTTAALELSLPQAVLKNAQVSAAVGYGNIKTVRIELIGPFEDTVTRLDVATYLERLDENSPCRRLFTDAQNYLIYQVLGVSGLKYVFLNDSNQSVVLTADLLSGIGLSPELQHKYAGKASLDLETPILVGYRGWKVTQAAGAVGAPLVLKDVSGEALEGQRDASR